MLQASFQALLRRLLSNARYATLPTQLTHGSKTRKISHVLDASDPVDNPVLVAIQELQERLDRGERPGIVIELCDHFRPVGTYCDICDGLAVAS